jgi:hypothetical protein
MTQVIRKYDSVVVPVKNAHDLLKERKESKQYATITTCEIGALSA